MILDYKDVRFSFQSRKIRHRKRTIKLLLTLLILAGLSFAIRYVYEYRLIRKTGNLLMEEKIDTADSGLKKIERTWFLRNDKSELRSLILLFRNDFAAAQKKFQNLKEIGAETSLPYEKFLRYFSDHGRYRQMKIYTDYLLSLDLEIILWYRALCQTALLDPQGSKSSIAKLSPPFRQENQKAIRILEKVNAEEERGRLDYVFDRTGAPLAYLDVPSGITHSLTPGITFDEFAPRMEAGVSFYTLSLDLALQKKIQRAFGDFSGTFVLLDVHDGGTVVAFSKPKLATSGNTVFSEEYEPGSIIKVITLLAYLKTGPNHLFPLQCPGWMKTDEKTFYDSLKHGEVSSFEEALALSCNLSFAKMGLALGYGRLATMLEKFGFNGNDFRDLFLVFKTGKFTASVNDDFGLANLSVGLNEISVTTIHAGLIAEILSRNGTFSEPFLIDSIRNVLNLGFYSHHDRINRIMPGDPNFAAIGKAMIEVVENENGTGRRARMGTVRLAIKTGTAGSSENGLDAIVIGFFPVEKPDYAFALRLEGGGKAEFNGAYVLRDFLKLLYPTEK